MAKLECRCVGVLCVVSPVDDAREEKNGMRVTELENESNETELPK